jgi:hypothetical protein
LNLITAEEDISPNEFKDVYEKDMETRAVVRGFINYLKKPARRLAGGSGMRVRKTKMSQP